ncbi:rubrerythrin-like domain-containing protein [Natronorubrum halophilum]|nr:rubrerythrin-like domain-containing protein [Natronorubrum halophilum]
MEETRTERKMSPHLYECMVCGHREKGIHPMVCPNCAGEMQNLDNPREQ